MRNSIFGLLGVAYLASAGAGHAFTRFVNASNTAPASPYITWATAATNIQTAVDVATTGDTVLVTNGLYTAGGRVMYGSMTNRVAITKPIAVQSVNGPAMTTIQGQQDPAGPNGDGAIRCAYLVAGARLVGFTLTNGATRASAGDWANEQGGGGAWCESSTSVISNCVLAGNFAYDHGGGAVGGTLLSCLLTNNAAVDTPVASGGGAYSSVLSNCTLLDNDSLYGGGGASATLTRCILTGNSAAYWGGGASFSTLSNCKLSVNWATFGGGGGAYSCTLSNCALSGNWVEGGNGGGGAYSGTLYNCILNGNLAYACDGGGATSADLMNCLLTANQASSGGGSSSCTLNNCTLSGNWASFDGGGDSGGFLTNCIVYFNNSYMLSGSNWSGSVMCYSSTRPLPSPGTGNFTNAPVFIDAADGDFHLLAGSPGINAGLNAAAPGPVDLDGNPRIVGSFVDLGAYEWQGRPVFVNVQRPTAAGMTLTLVGETGRTIEFHASSNLTQWFLLVTRTNTTGQIVYTDSGATNQPRRFYKAIQLP